METTNEQLSKLKTSIFHANEIRTNRLIGYVMFFLAILYSISGILNYIDIFEKSMPRNYIVYFSLSGILIAGLFLAKLVSKKFVKPIKVILLLFIIIDNTVTGCYFYIYSHVIFTIPIFLSAGYYSRRITVHTSIMVWLGFMVSMFYSLGGAIPDKSFSSVLQGAIIPQTWVVMLFMTIGIFMSESGKRQINSQAEKTIKLTSMESEITLSARIQSSVLPPSRFVSNDNAIQIDASIFPAKEVAGDFYDYYPLDNDNMAIVIADVSDKGLPAAMFMMQSRESIRNLVHHNKSLLEAINKANHYLTKNNKGGMFVTAWIGIFNTKTGIGKYVNAGHLPPIIKRSNGTIELLENDPDIFMGAFRNAEYKSHIFELRKGDTLVLYTDGVTDAPDDNNQAFGIENLKKVVAKNASPEFLFSEITNAVNYSQKNLFDDITLLSLQSNIDFVPLTFDIKTDTREKNVSEIIDKVNALLEKVGCPDDTRKSTDIIIDEICENIADYAYGDANGEMHVKCDVGANIVTLTFEDYGKAFNPLNESTPEEGSILNIGGFGIHFVKNLSDEVSYQRIYNMNRLTVKLLWNI